MTANKLSSETSPYLLQHADNPVAWRPWGPDALTEAKDQNKPVLLSVGYAACHWCHVMAHESFENPEIAALMNDLFINIKVDREERPDIDAIYQHALALLGQQGGWPLTMFLNSAGEPFWGGTYFPPTSRYGRPGFPDVLRTIHEYWTDRPDDVTKNVTALRGALSEMAQTRTGGGVALETIERAALRLDQEFDKRHGGIGSAPKFPNPSILELLWRTHLRCGHEELGQTVTHTLDRMCQGGIYDHLGGGFARYSTDERWLAPHFEKMLYDNAQLIELLGWGWALTGNGLFETRLRETIDWAEREMISESGAFAATLDADSEGEEGKFYVWDEAEIREALGDEADVFCEAYDVTAGGNWERNNILNRSSPTREFSDAEEGQLSLLRGKLLTRRAGRIRPGWDDKVLADWNGLMVSALAQAAILFDEPRWMRRAENAFDFCTQDMIREGRLYHSWRTGILNHTATLDDYACLIKAALSLFELTGNQRRLTVAENFTAILSGHYWDNDFGGYFFTADDAEALIVRNKNATDHATPAGNGLMVSNLARLWFLTGNEEYRERADTLIKTFAGEIDHNFFPHAALMNGIEFLQTAAQLVIIGPPDDPVRAGLLRTALTARPLNTTITLLTPDGDLPIRHPAAGKPQINDKTTAYFCRNGTCSLPVTSTGELKELL